MKQLIPHFYPNFACIASRCSDSCCIGWEIDIDPDTADYYRSCITDGDPFSPQLSQKICWESPAHFLLKEDDEFTMEVLVPDILKAPVQAGELVGSVAYYINGQIVDLFPVYTASEVKKIDLEWRLRQVIDLWQMGNIL